MKLIALTGCVGIVGGGLYLHNPFEGGEVYPLAAPAALELVQGVEFHGRVKGMLVEGGRSTDAAIDRAVVPGQSVVFTFRANGKTIGTYTVSAKPVDDAHTRVTADFAMAPDADANMPGVMMPMAKQFAMVGKAMVDESVDAALDGRDYDRRVDTQAMMAYTAANPGEIMKGANQAMDAAVALQEQGGFAGPRHTSPAASTAKYRDGVAFVPGKPMTSAKTY